MARGQHWAHINECSFVAGMRLLFWIFRLFGRGPFRLVLYPVLLSYFISKSAARAASYDYLQHLYHFNPAISPKPSYRNIWRHFKTFAETILDKMLLWSGLFKLSNASYHGQYHILNNLQQRRGGLFICAHLGNLELCRVLAKEIPALKLTLLMHTKHARTFNQLLGQLDPASQLNIMQVTEITPATAIQLTEKVARGEFVVIAGDRIPVTANPRVIFTPFLGHPAPFPIGPYVLASLLKCPVYLLFSLRTRNSAEFHFEPFRDLIQLPRKNREQALTDLVTDFARRLTYYCQRAPLQWFNFYDFWQLPSMETSHDASKQR